MCREKTLAEAGFGGANHFLVKEMVNQEPYRSLDTDHVICKGNSCSSQEEKNAWRISQVVQFLWFILFMILFKNHVIFKVMPSREEESQR
jgi:hypothetical protein